MIVLISVAVAGIATHWFLANTRQNLVEYQVSKEMLPRFFGEFGRWPKSDAEATTYALKKGYFDNLDAEIRLGEREPRKVTGALVFHEGIWSTKREFEAVPFPGENPFKEK